MLGVWTTPGCVLGLLRAQGSRPGLRGSCPDETGTQGQAKHAPWPSDRVPWPPGSYFLFKSWKCFFSQVERERHHGRARC